MWANVRAEVRETSWLAATPVIRTDCDVQFFSTIDEVEAHGAERKFRVTKGKAALLGIQRDWVHLEYEKQSVHYEFRSDQLALVTITKR